MPDQENLEAKFQVRQEYENITQTMFWAILSQEVNRKLKNHTTDLEHVNLEIQAHVASRDQGRVDLIRWLIKTVKDIKDGKISMKTPSKILEV